MRRLTKIGSKVLARTAADSVFLTVNQGIMNGLLISTSKALCDADKVTVTLRGTTDSKVLVPGLSVLQLSDVMNLKAGAQRRTTTGSEIYLPLGCLSLAKGQELAIQVDFEGAANVNVEGVSTLAATAAGTIEFASVYLQALPQHSLQYVQITGNINAKDMQELYIMNCDSYPTAVITLGFLGNRESVASANQFLAASNTFRQVEANLSKVACAYLNPDGLIDLTYVNTDNQSVQFLYVQIDMNEETVNDVVQWQNDYDENSLETTKNVNPNKYNALISIGG
jgi:hypothetical protein